MTEKSRAYAFRLSQDIPAEAKAISILDRWLENDNTNRHTMTSALLALDNIEPPRPRGFAALERAIDKLDEITDELSRAGISTASVDAERIGKQTSAVSSTLRRAMHDSVKFDEDGE